MSVDSRYVLIISHDVVGNQMAGPGIRYYHLARVLAKEFPVILAAPNDRTPDLVDTPFKIIQYDRQKWASIESLLSLAKVVIFPSDIANDFPQLADMQIPLVIDGYDPLLAEWLFIHLSLPLSEQRVAWNNRMCHLNRQYVMGDFFLCASERQRDWWLGLLEANGRINPDTLSEDPSLRSLIDVVAFGLPETPIQHTKKVIKSVWPGIGMKDRVILWGGGLWPWLDPLTAIRAMAKVWKERKDVRLIFPGTKHPNPWVSGIRTHNQAAFELSKDLDLMDKAVFWGDWMPYADWGNVLMESDAALALHYDTLETRLAFRSRILEYIWGGLPIVATRGDATSEIIAKYGLGLIVDYEDENQVAEAILQLLETPVERFGKPFESARQDLSWEKAVQPLFRFCRDPRRSPDKIGFPSGLGNPYYLNMKKGRKLSRYGSHALLGTLRKVNNKVKGVGRRIERMFVLNQKSEAILSSHKEKATKWLKGKGIEIGAFKTPIDGIRPIYIDKFRCFDHSPCRADIFCEPDRLPFRSDSLDYVASSHVLEHIANPIAAICEWYRVLRPGGIIYLVVPDRRFTWDHRRDLTSYEHLMDDYTRGVTDCDEAHIGDFVENVDWAQFDPTVLPEVVPQRKSMMKKGYYDAVKAGKVINLHFHVFEAASVMELFKRLCEEPLTKLRLTILDYEEKFPANNPNGFLIVVRADKEMRGVI